MVIESFFAFNKIMFVLCFYRCLASTKSDYVELSNFQDRDRKYSRFCGLHKPSSVISDGAYFHIAFFSNNVFDGKGFQASYYFVNIGKNFLLYKYIHEG